MVNTRSPTKNRMDIDNQTSQAGSYYIYDINTIVYTIEIIEILYRDIIYYYVNIRIALILESL